MARREDVLYTRAGEVVLEPPIVRAAPAVLTIGIDGSSAPGAAVDSTVIESGDVGSCVALDEDGVRLVPFQETKISFVEPADPCHIRRVFATHQAISVLLSEVAAGHVVELPLRTLVRTVAETASRVRRLHAECAVVVAALRVAVECISAFAVVDFLAQCIQVVLLAVERVQKSTVVAERTKLLAFYTVDLFAVLRTMRD